MRIRKLNLEGLIIFEPVVYPDQRGFFQESYHQNKYCEYLPKETVFVQDNTSYSKYGTIKGLHYQKEPYAQAKLVRCTLGTILDVVVDIRLNSITFGKFESVVLSDENRYQLFIPKGFAHGFSVLSNGAIVEYKCDEYYNPQADAGIRFDDPNLNIDWGIELVNQITSDKDKMLPYLTEIGEKIENTTIR